jgi:hypothetical protein
MRDGSSCEVVAAQEQQQREMRGKTARKLPLTQGWGKRQRPVPPFGLIQPSCEGWRTLSSHAGVEAAFAGASAIESQRRK